MELLQLKYFFESAKNENFSQTAEKHWVPPSSVSAAIKRLEEELGCQLFDRQSNRITLNENGKRLQKSLLSIFDELDEVVEELKQPTVPATEIKIVVLSLRERMARALVAYQMEHPETHVCAIFNVCDPNLSDYDIIIAEGTDDYPEYERRELCSFQLCFTAPADSPLVGRRLTMKDLRNESFITMDLESESSVLVTECKKAGFSPNIVVRTNDPHYYKKCAQMGLGIGLWRKYAVLSDSELSYLTVEDFDARQTMYLYYKHTPMSRSLKEFIDFLMTRQF